MSSATVTVNFVASGGNQIATNANEANTAVKALGTSSQTASNEVAGLGTKSQTAAAGVSKVGTSAGGLRSVLGTLRANITTVAGSMSTLIGTGVTLISNWHAIADAQNDLTKAQNAVARNNTAIEAAQIRLNNAIAKYGPNSDQARIAAQKLANLQAKQAPLAHSVEVAQRGVNEAYLNFVENLVPSLLTGVGGIVSLFGGLSSKAAPAEKAVAGLGNAFATTGKALPGASSGLSSFGTALKGILLNPFTIALTALSLLL